MSDESRTALRSAKSANIIADISEMHGVTLKKAADIYYCSETSNMIEEGVADLHCRSDKYLAEEIWREYQNNDITENI